MKNHIFFLLIIVLAACQNGENPEQTSPPQVPDNRQFSIELSDEALKVVETGSPTAWVTQHVKSDFRPYLHPILAPGSTAELTQYSPGHHKHQTGLYWGFTRVNGTGASEEELKKWFYNKDKPEAIQRKIGRDFFHHPEGEYWKKVSANILIPEGEKVRWQTVYLMLDENGEPMMKETQIWSFTQDGDKNLLDLEWTGEALRDITINQFDYGGLFLRMPWNKEVKAELVTAARHRNQQAEGQRAMWVDLAMEIEGLEEWGHMAIFDHPDNPGFPQSWRVDGQFGIGPVSSRNGDWQIARGETATFRHQIVAYEGELNDVEMNEQWADYVGDHGMYNTAVLWGIAQQEGREAKLLSPQEAVDHMTIKEGYRVNAYASEPMITQPMAFCWDDRGRMWIAENRDYESRGAGFSNSGDSRILILEDTDRDGVADKQSVFLEGIPFPAAIAVGFDGLFLGAPPNLLFVPDRNGDDKADIEDIEVRLTGWGIRDRHETINSLHWGPDGWLYGLEGFATPSKIRKPKGKGKIYRPKEPFPDDLLEAEGVDINGGVWRYHPTKDRFEVVAHGFSNPWGIDYDAKGQLFISACVIPHLFHVIPGGIYHRQGGSHFNSFVYQDIQTIVDHRHRSAHGGARVYLSDAFPPEQQGRIFMANIHEHAVLSDQLHREGSGFRASHGEDFMLANNAQWIGFSMEIGPEGGLYVLDWHDADICGKEVVNKETGRVFRIMPEQSQAVDWPGRYEDLNRRSDLDLVGLQANKSSWHVRRARNILQKRASKKAIDAPAVHALNKMLDTEKNGDFRLNALWSLHQVGQLEESKLIDLLGDKDPYIRAWAVQFLVEDRDASSRGLQALAALSEEEKAPVVRMYLATALQRIAHQNRWEIAEDLVQYEEDADDHNIPLMLWYGLEPLVAQNPERALALAKSSQIPLIADHISRRLVDEDRLVEVVAALQQKSDRRKELLEGLLAGLEGRKDVKTPEQWTKVELQLKSDPVLRDLALQVSQYFGSVTAAKEMMAVVRNTKAGQEKRQEAISALASQQREELIAEIPGLLEDPDLRIEAIRAVAAYNQSQLGQLLLKKYPSFNLSEKQEAIQSFASRPVYGRILAEALRDKQIPKKDIPAYVALQLRRVVGNGFVEIWGPIDELSSDKQATYAKYQRLLTPQALAAANPGSGRKVYQRTCWSCHKMYGEGGNVGPDLTGSNRANIAYLLSNIIDPSGVIQDDYKMVVITTQDGRTYSGNIISENDRQLTLRTVGQEAVVLNKSEIQSNEQTTKSLMPEGLLNTLTEKEVLDLVAYLQTTQQVAQEEVLGSE